MDPGLMALLAVMCLVMLSISMLRRSERRRATAREVTREQVARIREQRDISSSLDELLVRLEQFSRDINAQIETRCVKIETLIRDADARIAQLERLRGESGGDGTGGNAGPAPGFTAPAAERRRLEAGSIPAVGGLPTAERRPRETPSEVPMAARRTQVYSLADGGASAATIARDLRMPLGEVELLLKLRQYGT